MTLYAGTTWTLEAALGQPFTASPSWTDISAYVRNDPQVSINRGRSTELDDVQPGSMTFLLDNRTRTFDPTFGPANVDFDGTSSNYWSCPDQAGFSGASQLDVRMAVAMDDWSPASAILGGQWTNASRCFRLAITSGKLTLQLSTTGANLGGADSAAVACGSNGQIMCLRYTWENTGGTVSLYCKRTTKARCKVDAQSDDGWLNLGTTGTAFIGSTLFNSTATPTVGADKDGTGFAGVMYYYQAATTIGGAPLIVWWPGDGTAYGTAVSTSWVSTLSTALETWTKTGTAQVLTQQGTYYGKLLPQTRIRFTATYSAVAYKLFDGFVEQWPQAYRGPSDATVSVTAIDAFGIFANTPAASSPFGMNVAAEKATGSNIVGYWPLDEETVTGGATEMYSGLAGHYEGLVEVRDPIVPTSTSKSKAFPIFTSLAPARLVVTKRWEDTVGFGVFDSLCLQFWVDVQESNSEFDVITTIDYVGGAGFAQGLAVVRDPDDPYCLGFEAYAMFYTNSGAGGAYAPFHLPEGVHFVQVYNPGGAVSIVVDGVAQPSVNYSDGPAGGAPFDLSTWPTLYISGHGSVGGSTISDVVLGTYLGYGYTTGAFGRTGEDSGTRTGWELDSIAWPSGQRTLTTDPSTVLAAVKGGGTALSQLKSIVDAEQGRLYMGADGKVVLRSRTWQRYNTKAISSQATFGDSGSEIRYSEIGIEAQSLQFVRNQCTVSTTGGASVTYEDDDSITAYGVRTDSVSSVPLNLVDAYNLAIHRVTQWAQPLDRIPAITIQMLSTEGAGVATTIPAVLALDLGYRVTVNRRPQSVGSAITGYFTVEGIQHSIGSGMWTVTLNLAPAPLTATEAGMFTLATAYLYILDSSVVVPY